MKTFLRNFVLGSRWREVAQGLRYCEHMSVADLIQSLVHFVDRANQMGSAYIDLELSDFLGFVDLCLWRLHVE